MKLKLSEKGDGISILFSLKNLENSHKLGVEEYTTLFGNRASRIMLMNKSFLGC
jgi:hypothetical protein